MDVFACRRYSAVLELVVDLRRAKKHDSADNLSTFLYTLAAGSP
jgi:hypothetical protein